MGDFLYIPSPLRGRVREEVERFTFPLAPSLKGGRTYAVRPEHVEWGHIGAPFMVRQAHHERMGAQSKRVEAHNERMGADHERCLVHA